MKLTIEIIGHKPAYKEGEPDPVQRPLELAIEWTKVDASHMATQEFSRFPIDPANLDDIVFGIRACAGDEAAELVRQSILAYVEDLGDSARWYVNYGRACMDAWSNLAEPVRRSLGHTEA